MKVFVVRHGEIDWSRESNVQWNSNESQLSELWKKQARMLVLRLKKYVLKMIYVNPLEHTLDTAIPIILENPFTPYVEIEELKEWDIGNFTSTIKPENGVINGIANTSETIEKLQERVNIGWKKIKQIGSEKIKQIDWKDEEVNVLVVWDLDSNRALVAKILWYDNMELATKQDNGALSIYDVPVIWPVQIIVENDITHLYDKTTETSADL